MVSNMQNTIQNKEFKFIMIIAALILTMNLCSGIMGPKIINLTVSKFNLSVTCGVIPFCVSFFLMDIFTNQYGFNLAKQLSIGISICNFVMGVTLYFLTKIPATHSGESNIYYQTEFDPVIKAFFVGSIAIIIAFYINCKIFSKLFFTLNGKYLWLRCITATSVGELIYSSIFDGLFFAHKLSAWQISDIVINNYGFKFMFEVITLPLTYLAVNLLTQFEDNIEIRYINFDPQS